MDDININGDIEKVQLLNWEKWYQDPVVWIKK